MNFIEIIIYVVLPIVAGVYWFLKKKYEYFENLGIPYSKPSMLFGNMTGVGTKKHFADVMNEIYNENKKKDVICGFFTLITPSVFVYDLDAIKDILIKDFNNFTDRGMYVNEEDDPLSAHLFSIEGEKWRFLRNKLSPVFTSGKIKNMMPIITEKSDNLVNELEKIAKSNNNSLDAKLLMNNFTIDVICSTVFGMEANTLKGEHKELAKITKEIFSEEGVSSFRFFILFAFPKLAKFFRMRNFPKHISDFFFDVIGGNMKNREDNNIVRKDFLDMLMQLMNKGSIEGEISTDNRKLTFNEAVAQGFLFFFAGSDTSSTALSYALVELSHNPRVQDKLRKEIKEKVASSNGVITYENIQEMTYLSYVVNEALRKYPPALMSMRKSINEYKIPNTKHTIPAGMTVMIPTMSIQMDEKFFENPHEFRPERFAPEEAEKIPNYAFMPFGEGPRNCIGMRFALINVKVAIAATILHFNLTPNNLTPYPVVFDPKNPGLAPKGGSHVKITKVEN